MNCFDDDGGGCFYPAPPLLPWWKRASRWLNPVYVYRRIVGWWRWRKFLRAGGFKLFGAPLVRRVFPNLIAQDIVSVQPMTTPSSLVFVMDYKYGSGSSD
jgi:hypothetical protein